MKDIIELRSEIDSIDEKIKKLLVDRFKLVDEIKEYKLLNGIEITDKNREKEIIEMLTKDLDDKTKRLIVNVFMEILKESRDYQKK